MKSLKVKTTLGNDLFKTFSGTCILGQHTCKRNDFKNQPYFGLKPLHN